MPIPSKHANRFIYHFTHIDNLGDILPSGFLCNTHPDFPQSRCRSIAERAIQARRAEMEVTCGPGGAVHDYVPLYFGSLSPMLLAVINKKNVDQMDIVYFEFPISLLDREDVVFTDASANTAIPPNFYEDPSDLDNLNWADIDSLKWGSPDDLIRHQRMAEVLVFSSLPLMEAARVVVWNRSTKAKVEALVKESGVPFPPIEFESPNRRHYFTNFWDSAEKGQSPVKGPREVAMNYRDACKQIAAYTGGKASSAFRTPKDLLIALRKDFACLPHTAELVGLQSENGVHRSPVDVHTLEVVKKLLGLPEFARLARESQCRIELAAYLHDIGKGPKSRWAGNGGLQRVDPNHPARAMPMMAEILTKYVRQVKQRNAELIVKLVCYHDLVGEVLGKGRDEQQIVEVAADELELDMLFALGKADATSLVEWWWNEDEAEALRKRCSEAIRAQNAV